MVKFTNKDGSFGYANFHGWSDVSPYEIVKVISDKTLEIREMDAEKLHTTEDLGFVYGGFFGHATRNVEGQKWDIKSNLNNPVIRIRKHKSGQWKNRGGSRFNLAEAPHKHYDYNF
jgi:hypothetical protein